MTTIIWIGIILILLIIILCLLSFIIALSLKTKNLEQSQLKNLKTEKYIATKSNLIHEQTEFIKSLKEDTGKFFFYLVRAYREANKIEKDNFSNIFPTFSLFLNLITKKPLKHITNSSKKQFYDFTTNKVYIDVETTIGNRQIIHLRDTKIAFAHKNIDTWHLVVFHNIPDDISKIGYLKKSLPYYQHLLSLMGEEPLVYTYNEFVQKVQLRFEAIEGRFTVEFIS